MDEFLSSLVANSNNFIGGRTIFPGPAAVPSRGHGPVVLPSTSTSAASSSAHRQHGIMAASQQVLGSRQENVISQGAPPSSSILRLSDMSPMIAWLKSQSSVVTESEPSTNQSSEVYTFEDYQKRIPKPYIELTERDCAGVVAKAIKSIVLHTCNDEFRQKCFSKLGASNSRDVEREVHARLVSIIEQQEEEEQNESDDGENQDQENDPNVASVPPPQPQPVFESAIMDF